MTSIALNTQILCSIIMRGSISDCSFVTAYLRELKRDVIDKHRSFKYEPLLRLYWMYSIYLIFKRWDMQNYIDELASFSEQLAVPSYKTVLLLLEKPDIDHQKLLMNLDLIDSIQSLFTADISWKEIDQKLKSYFSSITQQKNDIFGISFEKIQENNQKENELATIIKQFSRQYSKQ